MQAFTRWATFAARFRGGERASALASGVLLGLVTGLTAGAHLTSCVLLLAATVARVNLPIWGLALATGTALGWAVAPLLYLTGWLILDWLGLRYALALLGESLPVALWDGNRYALVGGLAWGFGLGIVAARVVRRQARRRLQEIRRGPVEILVLPRGRAAVIAQRSAWLLTRLAWGPSRGPSPAAMSRSWRMLAPSQGLGVLLLLAWAFAGYHWRAQALVDELFHDRLAQVAGSRWTFAEVRYAPLTGELVAQGVQVAWATDLGPRGLVCDRLTARFEPGPAWLGRLAVREVALAGVHPLAVQPAQPATDAMPAGATPLLAQERAESAVPWEAALEGWVTTWVREQAPLEQVQALVRALERLAQHDLESADLETAQPLDWLACRRRRAELDWHRARLEIARLDISDLDPGWGWPASTRLELAGISSRPVVSGRPTPLLVLVPESHLALEMELKLHELGQRHPLRIEATDVNLDEICRRAPPSERLHVSRGRLHLSATGWADGEHLDLAGEIRPRQLQLELSGQEPWEGRPADQWNHALTQLPPTGLPLALRGPWTSPELAFDSTAWQTGLAEALARADAGTGPDPSQAVPVTTGVADTASPAEMATSPDVPPSDERYVAATLEAFGPGTAPAPTVGEPAPPMATAPRAAPPAARPPVVAAVPAADEAHPEFTEHAPPPRRQARRSSTLDVGDALTQVVEEGSNSSRPGPPAPDEPGRFPTVEPLESAAQTPAELPPWPPTIDPGAPATASAAGLDAFAGPTSRPRPAAIAPAVANPAPEVQEPALVGTPLPERTIPAAARPRAEVLPPWLAPRVAVRAARAAGEKVPRVPGPIDLARGASPPRAVPAWPAPAAAPAGDSRAAEAFTPRSPRETNPRSTTGEIEPPAVQGESEPAGNTEATEVPAEPEWSSADTWPEVPPMSGDPFGDYAGEPAGNPPSEPARQVPNGWLARMRRGLGERTRRWRTGDAAETVAESAPDAAEWPAVDPLPPATSRPGPRSAPLAERQPSDGSLR